AMKNGRPARRRNLGTWVTRPERVIAEQMADGGRRARDPARIALRFGVFGSGDAEAGVAAVGPRCRDPRFFTRGDRRGRGPEGHAEHPDTCRRDLLAAEPVPRPEHVEILLGAARPAAVVDVGVTMVAEVRNEDSEAGSMKHPRR